MYVLSTELKGRFPMIWTSVDSDRNVSLLTCGLWLVSGCLSAIFFYLEFALNISLLFLSGNWLKCAVVKGLSVVKDLSVVKGLSV